MSRDMDRKVRRDDFLTALPGRLLLLAFFGLPIAFILGYFLLDLVGIV